MRCFEIAAIEAGYSKATALNNNMRCFEMKVSMGSPDRELVKQ